MDATTTTLKASYDAAVAAAKQAERESSMGTNAAIRKVNRMWGKARKAANAYEAALVSAQQ